MIKKVYEMQKCDTSQGDFYELILRDKESLGINLSDTEIANLRRENFKKIVKSKTRQAAFEYLQSLKQGH